MKQNAVNSSRPQLSESLTILKFYCSLIRQKAILSIVVVFLGFVTRALTVVVFIFVLKVFLSILEPETSVKAANGFLLNFLGFELDQQQVLAGLVGVLSVLVLFQFVISKLNLHLFLRLRASLLSLILKRKLNDHVLIHLNICLDKIPQGIDAIIKSSEILFFYFILLTVIFYLSPLAGLLVLLIVPGIVIAMLLNGRKEVHVQAAMQAKRKTITTLNDDLDGFLRLNEQAYLYGRNSIIHGNLLAGLAIVCLILVFLFFAPEAERDGLQGFTAIFLVFSVRFAIVYAGELSRLLGRVLQQRVIVERISTSLFK